MYWEDKICDESFLAVGFFFLQAEHGAKLSSIIIEKDVDLFLDWSSFCADYKLAYSAVKSNYTFL